MRNELTQDRLKELLEYNPETGVFTRLVNLSGGARAGDIAGCADNKGYLVIRADGRPYKSHRLAFLYMTGEFPPDQVDHLNGVKGDNRWANLRHATHTENMRNQKRSKRNKSGVMGVHWIKHTGKWQARIHVDGKRTSLGLFDMKHDAIIARKSAECRCGYHPNHGRNNV